MMRSITTLLGLGLLTGLFAASYDKVKITPDISYVYIYHKGKAVKAHRIQDTKHKLTGDYARTFRPGTHIQPIDLANGVQTVGEVEVLEFMQQKVNKKKGLILDVRDKASYKQESIPSAVNIPVRIKDNAAAMEKIFTSMGMKKNSEGTWDSGGAIELMVYCDGLWCVKSTEMVEALLAKGYPAEKIYYYRGGFQMWKILGFTTARN